MFRQALICSLFVACAAPGHAEAKDADRNGPVPASRQAAAQSVTLAGTGYRISFGAPRDWIGDAAAQAKLLHAIAAWLSITLELPSIQSTPSIKLESEPRLKALRYTGQLSDRPEDMARLPQGQREIAALYDRGTDTIYLREGWTGNTPAELSILVHEMVHYVQDVAGIKYPCLSASEELAYVAQDRWLGLFGADLAAEFGIDRLTLFVSTRCFI